MVCKHISSFLPISCILALIFQILIKYFTKCEGKGSFLKSEIKSLINLLLLNKKVLISTHNISVHMTSLSIILTLSLLAATFIVCR